MVVKDRIGRRRYIVFRVQAPRELSRREMVRAVRRSVYRRGPDAIEQIKPWLIMFEKCTSALNDYAHGAPTRKGVEYFGILRCTHTTKQEAIDSLNSINSVGREKTKVRVETLRTSGTIRGAKKYIHKKIS